jgi:glycosyltransferase involved in cell wall biosynthesis
MPAAFDLVRIFPNRPLTKARSDPVFIAAQARAYVRAGLPVEILAPRWRVLEGIPFDEAAHYFNLPREVTIRHLGPSLSEDLPELLLRLSLAIPPLAAGRRTAGAVLHHHKDPLALAVAQLHRGVHVLEMTEVPTQPVARAAMRIVDGCVAIAPHLATALEERFPRLRGRVLSVRGGFDPDLAPWGAVDAAQARRQYRIAADERVVCYSGKTSRTSNELPWILQAGAGLDLTFMVVGVTDDTERWLESLVPAGCRLITIRHVPPERLAEIYAAADLVVSYYESSHSTLAWIDPGKFPMYLASGRPIVAADHPSYADLLQDGVNAALAAPDDPAALAATYRRVLEDRELADRLQQAGRRSAEATTIDRRAQLVLEFAASLRS